VGWVLEYGIKGEGKQWPQVLLSPYPFSWLMLLFPIHSIHPEDDKCNVCRSVARTSK
jgi:hypothetical protein